MGQSVSKKSKTSYEMIENFLDKGDVKVEKCRLDVLELINNDTKLSEKQKKDLGSLVAASWVAKEEVVSQQRKQVLQWANNFNPLPVDVTVDERYEKNTENLDDIFKYIEECKQIQKEEKEREEDLREDIQVKVEHLKEEQEELDTLLNHGRNLSR